MVKKESVKEKIKCDSSLILSTQYSNFQSESNLKSKHKLEKLEEKERENAILNREIKKIHDEKEDFERNCKENFAKKFEEVQNEKLFLKK